MTHLQAIAADLTQKGYLATYTGEDSNVQGLYRITITNPQLTKTLHINCWRTTPQILFLSLPKEKPHIDLNDPTSLTALEQILQHNLIDDALEE